ncbi:putative lysozyme-like protein [Diabrotica virgifera virgifera]|uniref:Lysozyme-like protein n=1 Tax=Diabrotica virgifera virgifera TaxID=50390 RepID=A0A6P7EZ40_DIAVI|nr:putative lysozyme-like protein [Diabrotica virgifera virgifera]
MRKIVLVLFFVICAYAQDSFENTGVKLALKIYDDCSKGDGLSPCLKKKAITFIDRLGRMDKFSLVDGVTVQKAADAPAEAPAMTEQQLDETLPRSSDAKDEALTTMLFEKVGNFIGSRSIEIALPKIQASDLIEEGRKGSFGDSGGKRKGGKGGKGGKKGMMGMMMMGIGVKLAAMIPLAIAGLFLLAKKALIISKIALLISGIIAVKKFLAQKQGGGGGSGWQSGGGSSGWSSGGGHGGGGGGWQSSGGGWDKRSYEASDLAYSAYNPK